MKHFILSFFISIFSLSIFAENGSPESFASFELAFSTGVKFYQEKSYEKADAAFQAAVDFEPQNAGALANLGLTRFQLGKKGWALGLLRKAASLDPELSIAANGVEFIHNGLEIKELPHEIKSFEKVRESVLNKFSLFTLLVLVSLFLLGSGWYILKYIGARKRALTEELPIPGFSVFGVVFSISLVVFLFITFLKLVDLSNPRGTITADKASVLSFPEEKAPQLFEIYGGLEVVILKQDKDWVQISYPGGMSGWVPKPVVFQTTQGGFSW